VRTIHKGRAPASGKRLLPVLYVEDNDDNWEIVQLRLSRSYALQRAKNDREACAALQTPDAFYAVLMDIELAGSRLDGIKLTRLLRGKLPEAEQPEYARTVPVSTVPVLFMTAFGNVYTPDTLRDAGADHVLLKPVDFTKLSLALANIHLNRISERSKPP
jgi:CheY-like chemotaxis protein